MSTRHRHCVYAVLDGGFKFRVSPPMTWDHAIDLHEAMHGRSPVGPATRYTRPVVNPGYTVHGTPVRYFAVRSVNDPNWPVDAPVREAVRV
jgi:hypothetical protein